MGTHANFFVGHPSDLEGREWLGSTPYNGCRYAERLLAVRSEAEFREVVRAAAESLPYFCDPALNSYPYPWAHNIYVCDYTYAWMDGEVHVTSGDRGFEPLARHVMLRDDPVGSFEEARRIHGFQVSPLEASPAPASHLPKGLQGGPMALGMA